MRMRLLRYRVTDFRSVKDSGWIEADIVTALIGTNESGKTNLLLPLWKLNPASEGEINTTDDYPRDQLGRFRALSVQPVFVRAVFNPSPELQAALAQSSGFSAETFGEVLVQRRFSGQYEVVFPGAIPPREMASNRVLATIHAAETELESITELKTEAGRKSVIADALASAKSAVESPTVDAATLDRIRTLIKTALPATQPKTSAILARTNQLLDSVDELIKELSIPAPEESLEMKQMVMKALPKFVYYSNYGNLDSQIYLPHVIDNLDRTNLGAKDVAKSRTLKVLFKFVGLSPAEIRDLGKEHEISQGNPSQAQIDAIAEKKRLRSILLQSASGDLTKKFRDWWKQGVYRFRFEADGAHFRIWVSDDKRPDEIELEGRSTGLQWFLSFYLVFLVESADAHHGAILLLDEPGLSLHPMAQRDLSAFFDGLAETNQLLFTTHSPFLVDADHLDRARKVYVSADGSSKATADLRGGESDPNQRGSNYAVSAALGISVAESLMLGCTPVIVEGPSDQFYLSAIKTLLIASGRLKLGRELVFPPANGVKGVKALLSIMASKGDNLPLVLVDSDSAGLELAKALKKDLYQTAEARVVDFGSIVERADAEVEDLMPYKLLANEMDRLYLHDEPFSDVVSTAKAIVPQIKSWADAHGIGLQIGWKVELARRVKRALLNKGFADLDEDTLNVWQKLFATLEDGQTRT